MIFYLTTYEKPDPLAQDKEYISSQFEMQLVPERNKIFSDDDIDLSLNLTNKGNETIFIRPFDLSSIYFNITIWANYKPPIKMESRVDNWINGYPWRKTDERVSLGPGEQITFTNTMRAIPFNSGSTLENIEWVSLGKVIENILLKNGVKISNEGNVMIIAVYLPLNDPDFMIRSKIYHIHFKEKPTYELNIKRNVSQNEMVHLKEIESLNYSLLLNVSRYEDQWYQRIPNFIDEISIEKRISEYENFTNPTFGDGYHSFTYEVDVKRYHSVQIDKGNNSIEFMVDQMDPILYWYKNLTNEISSWRLYGNQELIERNDTKIDNGFIFKMSYSYSVWYGPLAAHGGGIHQEVVITDDMDVLCIKIIKHEWIS